MPLQYFKLLRNLDESTEEWMGRWILKATKCKYKEVDRRLKEQLINGIRKQAMTAEIIGKFKSLKR